MSSVAIKDGKRRACALSFGPGGQQKTPRNGGVLSSLSTKINKSERGESNPRHELGKLG
jgi:hypothetical protein